MIDRALTFAFRQTGGTATDEDYSAASAVISPYTKSTQLIIQTNEDFDTDASETLVGEIGVFGIADRYILRSGSVTQSPSFIYHHQLCFS